jgi:AcrR family transcriptional regulator
MMEESSEKSGIRKEQIVKAALHCFVQYGYTKTSLDDIANSIGIKKSSLYYYYKNKEAIFREVIETEVNRFQQIIREKLDSEKTARGKLILLFKTKLKFLREKHKTLDLSVQAMLEVQPIIEKLFQEFRRRDIDFLKTIIQQGIANGEFREIDAERVAEVVRMMMDSLRFREMRSSNVRTSANIDYNKIEKDAEFFLNLLIDGLQR